MISRKAGQLECYHRQVGVSHSRQFPDNGGQSNLSNGGSNKTHPIGNSGAVDVAHPWFAKIATWIFVYSQDFWGKSILANPFVVMGLALLIALICLGRAYVSLTGVDLYAHDAFVIFDAAWRMKFGQRPHIDFYSPFGVCSFLPTLAGFAFSNGSADAFGYGQALTGFLLSIWAYLIGRNRLSDVTLFFFCILVTLCATSSSAIGLAPLQLSAGMTYNRYGFALVELIIAESLLPLPPNRRAALLMGGVSTGCAIAILLFLKISFFLVAPILAVIVAPIRPKIGDRWLGLVAGFLVTTLAFASYWGFDLRPMLNDLRIAAGAKHIDFTFYFLDTIALGAACCTVLGIMAGLSISIHKKLEGRMLLIAGPVLAVCGCMLVLTNFEQAGFPLSAIFSLVILHHLHDLPEKSLLRFCVVLWCASFLFAGIGSDAASLTYAALRKNIIKRKVCSSFTSPVLKGFSACGLGETFYVNYVNEGFDLIRSYRQPGDSIMSLDFSNPFSYGLGMIPMHNGLINHQYGVTFTDKSRPSSERIFGTASLVIAAKRSPDDRVKPTDSGSEAAYMSDHFRFVGESKNWWLFRRK
jgi:hypothetical protein